MRLSIGAMRLPTMTLATKIGVGALGALAVAGAAVAVTAHTVGLDLHNSAQAATPPPAVSSPAPQPSAGAGSQRAKTTAKAVRLAMLQAEAQTLGITPKQLQADLKGGTTVQQLATQKGLSQAQFQQQFSADVKPLLDTQVAAGTITSKQEQKLLQRYATAVPNWSTVPKPKASALPSPPAA